MRVSGAGTVSVKTVLSDTWHETHTDRKGDLKMAWLSIVLQLIPVVFKLMKVAEELFDDQPDSGEQKKAYVMEAIHEMVVAAGSLMGNPELWAKIEKAISFLIDAACLFLFPKKA